MKTLFILLLFTMTAYSWPGNGNGNQNGNGYGHENHDEDDDNGGGNDEAPIDYDLISGIISIAGYELAKYAINKLKTKKPN